MFKWPLPLVCVAVHIYVELVCTQQTYYIILSFVFTIKSMGSELRKIKGHHVCHLKTLLPSLLTHPEKGHTIIYLIPPPFSLLSSPACNYPPTHPASQPASQPSSQPASQAGYEHIAGPEGSTVDNLHCVHMAEQRASEEDWHAETKQVYDSKAWAVKGEFLIQVNAAFGANRGLELSQETFTRIVTFSSRKPKFIFVVEQQVYQMLSKCITFFIIVIF